jgi:hypothetical protein
MSLAASISLWAAASAAAAAAASARTCSRRALMPSSFRASPARRLLRAFGASFADLGGWVTGKTVEGGWQRTRTAKAGRVGGAWHARRRWHSPSRAGPARPAFLPVRRAPLPVCGQGGCLGSGGGREMDWPSAAVRRARDAARPGPAEHAGRSFALFNTPIPTTPTLAAILLPRALPTLAATPPTSATPAPAAAAAERRSSPISGRSGRG